MTGRGAGYCAGYNVPGHANPTPGGRGFGRGGFGRGLGRRRAWQGPVSATSAPLEEADDIQTFRAQMQQIEQMLQSMQQRLDQLQGD
jgi:hypothetical protein